MKYLIAAILISGAALIYSGARAAEANCIREISPNVLMVGPCSVPVEQLHEAYLASPKRPAHIEQESVTSSTHCVTSGNTTTCTRSLSRTEKSPNVHRVITN